MTQAEFQTIYPIQDEDIVYRNTHIASMPKVGTKRIPNEAQFIADPDGMSVNWKTMIVPDRCIHTLGLTINPRGKFTDITGFRIFSLPVDFLRKVPGVTAVLHSPVYNGDPAAIGKPNNIAHASVLHDNSVEARIKMATYCQDNYDHCHCTPDITACIQHVEVLKLQGDQNDFHRLSMV